MRKALVPVVGVALLVALAASAAQADIVSNLAAYWKLDETAAGPVVNEVGPDGTNNGATIGQPGQIGTAYSFLRSSSQYVDTTLDSIIPASSDFSLFAWINTTSHTGVGTDYAGFIFSNYDPATGFVGRTALEVRDNNLRFFVASASIGALDTDVNDGAWHHVGVTRSSGVFELWVDGVSGSVATTGTALTSATAIGTSSPYNWRIGGPFTDVTTGTRYFDGLIDDVRVYHRALTASDVAELMAVPEPSSVLLLAMGLLAALSWRRRG